MTTLPRLELVDLGSPFDEAVLLVDGHEEETIHIDCPGALQLAARLVAVVNAHNETMEALTGAIHALRSYQYGNASPELARSIADRCEEIQKGSAS
jgi:hypothetical protein